jgi:hypothetical protein
MPTRAHKHKNTPSCIGENSLTINDRGARIRLLCARARPDLPR